MIVVQLKGGLGNQLFQYAAGLSLAQKLRTNLKVDISHYQTNFERNIELQLFNLQYEVATEADLKLFKQNFLEKILQRILPIKNRQTYREQSFLYDKLFFELSENVYLKGYWQSEKYFLPIIEKIFSQFILKQSFSAEVEQLKLRLINSESVAVHIRKGDYTNKQLALIHGTLNMDYYSSAMSAIEKLGANSNFYIFSDDVAFAKSIFGERENCTVVSGLVTKTALEDFYLMQYCSHNIIANSSFSWWAAYLNKNNAKKVFAPKQWFANKNLNEQTKDLIPESWTRV
jgi:hypothetical protein